MVNSNKGMTLVEAMVTITVLAIIAALGPSVLTNMFRYWTLSNARSNVQRDARNAMDLVNRNLRQATATSVTISQRPSQPPYSWIQFTIDKGTGPSLGNYGVYQEGRNLMFMSQGTTATVAENLRYLGFSYPRTDNSGIISLSMTFEEATFAGYSKALQLSIEKVRVMN
ncbi:MAG: hypothetical protein A2901_08300 [Elusimicrobia bacterium RIFCSPLOWO2_01_FULL_54_10]|nr:MAG: hypothetical protein A2901_08300 [Elusimicrobia bacterium RIFCSPLOWO2_01_FULL_54_10]